MILRYFTLIFCHFCTISCLYSSTLCTYCTQQKPIKCVVLLHIYITTILYMGRQYRKSQNSSTLANYNNKILLTFECISNSNPTNVIMLQFYILFVLLLIFYTDTVILFYFSDMFTHNGVFICAVLSIYVLPPA